MKQKGHEFTAFFLGMPQNRVAIILDNKICDFHIFLAIYLSLHGFIWNQHNDQLSVGLLAQLVEHSTGIAEVMGSNLVQA